MQQGEGEEEGEEDQEGDLQPEQVGPLGLLLHLGGQEEPRLVLWQPAEAVT